MVVFLDLMKGNDAELDAFAGYISKSKIENLSKLFEKQLQNKESIR